MGSPWENEHAGLYGIRWEGLNERTTCTSAMVTSLLLAHESKLTLRQPSLLVMATPRVGSDQLIRLSPIC